MQIRDASGRRGSPPGRTDVPRRGFRGSQVLALVVGGVLMVGVCATASVAGENQPPGPRSGGDAADAPALRIGAIEVGLASWYGADYHGKRTASGERLDVEPPTEADESLPFGRRVRVTHLTTGGAVTVRCPAEEESCPPRDGTVTDAAARVVKAVVTDALYPPPAPLGLDQETAMLAGSLTLGLTALFLADREIRDRVQATTGSTGRTVADGLTTAGNAVVVFGVTASLIALGLGQEQATGETRLRDASLVAMEAHLFAALLTSGLKRLTDRVQPEAGQGAYHFDPFTRDDSFPSGHASGVFAVAAVLADRYGGPVPILAYGAAGLVAASRIVLDRHWTSDVVAGSALGIVVGRSLSRQHADNERGFGFFPILMEDGTVGVAAGVRF